MQNFNINDIPQVRVNANNLKINGGKQLVRAENNSMVVELIDDVNVKSVNVKGNILGNLVNSSGQNKNMKADSGETSDSSEYDFPEIPIEVFRDSVERYDINISNNDFNINENDLLDSFNLELYYNLEKKCVSINDNTKLPLVVTLNDPSEDIGIKNVIIDDERSLMNNRPVGMLNGQNDVIYFEYFQKVGNIDENSKIEFINNGRNQVILLNKNEKSKIEIILVDYWIEGISDNEIGFGRPRIFDNFYGKDLYYYVISDEDPYYKRFIYDEINIISERGSVMVKFRYKNKFVKNDGDLNYSELNKFNVVATNISSDSSLDENDELSFNDIEVEDNRKRYYDEEYFNLLNEPKPSDFGSNSGYYNTLKKLKFLDNNINGDDEIGVTEEDIFYSFSYPVMTRRPDDDEMFNDEEVSEGEIQNLELFNSYVNIYSDENINVDDEFTDDNYIYDSIEVYGQRFKENMLCKNRIFRIRNRRIEGYSLGLYFFNILKREFYVVFVDVDQLRNYDSKYIYIRVDSNYTYILNKIVTQDLVVPGIIQVENVGKFLNFYNDGEYEKYVKFSIGYGVNHDRISMKLEFPLRDIERLSKSADFHMNRNIYLPVVRVYDGNDFLVNGVIVDHLGVPYDFMKRVVNFDRLTNSIQIAIEQDMAIRIDGQYKLVFKRNYDCNDENENYDYYLMEINREDEGYFDYEVKDCSVNDIVYFSNGLNKFFRIGKLNKDDRIESDLLTYYLIEIDRDLKELNNNIYFKDNVNNLRRVFIKF